MGGEMIKMGLTRLEWFETRFPRIAVNSEKVIREKLDERAALTRANNAAKAASNMNQQNQQDDSEKDRNRDKRDRSRSRSRSRSKKSRDKDRDRSRDRSRDNPETDLGKGRKGRDHADELRKFKEESS